MPTKWGIPACLPALVAAECLLYNDSGCTDGHVIETVHVTSAEACMAACEAAPGCCVGAWSKPLGGGPHKCYLKYDGEVEAVGASPGNAAFNCSPSGPNPKHCTGLGPPRPTPPRPPPSGPPPPPPPPCSLNGEGTPCRCDAGWTGANCGQLDLLPAPPLAEQVTPLAATTTNNTAANSTWGISVIGPDSHGTYHGYMTEIANHCPLGDYGQASQIVHMTAPDPLGPWTRQGVALKGFAHNPQAVVAPNGSIFLFHIGTEMNASCLKDCSPGAPTPPPGPDCPGLDHMSSLAVADSYEGPWTRYSYIIQHHGHPTNPAPYIFPNGTIFLGTRRYSKDDIEAFVGHVSTPQGPWVYYDTRVYSTAAGSIATGEEDSFIWRSRRGFHQVTHRGVPRNGENWPPAPSTGCGGGHLYSLDLRTWFFGENVFAHNASGDAQCEMRWTDSGETEVMRLTSRQRPTIYFGKDGKQYLYTGASGPWPKETEYQHSFTVVQQIRT